MNMKRSAIFSIFILLVGCGGGENSSPQATTSNSNLTVPLQTAFANIINKRFTKSFTVSGWIDQSTASNPIPKTNLLGSGNFVSSAATSVVFTSGPLNGQTALQNLETITGTITANGQTNQINSSVTTYSNPSNYTTLATISGGSTIYYAAYVNPATVKAGDAGTLYKANDNSSIGSYSVVADTAATLLVTAILDTYDSLGHTGQSTSVYRIDNLGNSTLLSITTALIASCCSTTPYEILTYSFK